MARTLLLVFLVGLLLGGPVHAGQFDAMSAAVSSRVPEDVRAEGAPSITADAAAVIDVETGVLLYGKSAWQRRAPASLTKVMTALVALDRARPTDLVTVSSRAASQGGATMGLKTGDLFTLGDLLFGLLLESGNDAAVAIAEHVAGSVEAFAGLMTDEAWIVGASRTVFANPHGFTATGHLSTAADLCRIGSAALSNPLLARMVRTPEFLAVEKGTGRSVWMNNTNRLLLERTDVVGMKTGTTPPAGRCLMFAAERDGRMIVGAVLHSDDRYGDATALIDHVFRAYERSVILSGDKVATVVPVMGGTLGELPVTAATDVIYPRAHGQEARLVLDVQRPLVAPVVAGAVVGTASAVGPGGTVTVALVAARDVPVGRFKGFSRH